MIHVGFTGTRSGMTERQKERVWEFVQYKDFYAHHGDCVGADAEFDAIVRKAQGCRGVIIHPPIEAHLRAFCKPQTPYDVVRNLAPYIDRNAMIVRESEVMLAAPKEMHERPRGGTWSTIRHARFLERPIHIFFPNGAVIS
jgi:hypothetical protein